jgi:hypothetical protein
VLQVVRCVDDSPNFFLSENDGEFSSSSLRVVRRIFLIVKDMVIQKLEAGNFSPYGVWRKSFVFQMEEIILHHILADLIRRFHVMPGQSGYRFQIGFLGFWGKVPQLHAFDHFVS